ncbi:hypothetical protein C8J56DRAFT_266659 [Mycena floridula]|nr:hypothetical protein C8J56DRAFT_266659 [Mycena floridula]
MKFAYSLFIAGVLVAPVACAPLQKRDVDASLIPDFGLAAGLNPTGTGDCDGITGPNGQAIKIPCTCPPDRASFVASLNANVLAGKVVNNPTLPPVTFPTDDSQASQLARIQTALVTLQNLRGPGQGCPAASTTFVAQQKAIQAGTTAGTPATTPSAPSAPSTGTSSGGVDPALVPDFGLAAGLNPTGTGDCDGITGPNGQAIKIPCTCPPDRASFIASLNANVLAGKVVNNPTLPPVTFPTDSSTASQLARLQTALVTLQNLRGPGQGCPAASTTFVAQQKALQA